MQRLIPGPSAASSCFHTSGRNCSISPIGVWPILARTLRDLQMQELIIHDPVSSSRVTPTGTVKIGG
jgi:hypothetical protein